MGTTNTPLTSTEIISLLKKGPSSSATKEMDLSAVTMSGLTTKPVASTTKVSKDELLGAVLGSPTSATIMSGAVPSNTGLPSIISPGPIITTAAAIANSPTSFTTDYTLTGLAELIRYTHGDRHSTALGINSEAFITALSATPAGIEEDLRSRTAVKLSQFFTSPWSEVPGGGTTLRRGGSSSTASPSTSVTTAAITTASNALESILPTCYNVQAPPHAATRIGAFTEETLFYMFYGMPRDRMQEMAARELTANRGWRFHKGRRLWLMPSSATPTASSMTAGISALRMSPAPNTNATAISPLPSSPTSKTTAVAPSSDNNLNMESVTASYIVFDAATWTKMRKELPVIQEPDLEDRFTVGTSNATVTSPSK